MKEIITFPFPSTNECQLVHVGVNANEPELINQHGSVEVNQPFHVSLSGCMLTA